jgi:DNA-binding transcriptional LysR family regulator
VSSVQAIEFSVQCHNRTESQPTELTQLVSNRALREEGGTAYLPSLAVPALLESMPGLTQVKSAPVIPQSLYSIVHVRKRHDPLVQEAIALIKKLIAERSIGKID